VSGSPRKDWPKPGKRCVDPPRRPLTEDKRNNVQDTNLIVTRLEDLKGRAESLRGYL